MSKEKLLDAFGQIEEAFIEEADPDQKKRAAGKRRSGNWIKWATYAACAVLVVGIGAPLLLEGYMSKTTEGLESGENEMHMPEAPEAVQDDEDVELIGSLGENQTEGSELATGSGDTWMAHFNEVTTVMDSVVKYTPGYFTEELSAKEIGAIEPEMRQEWMQYTGHAGFDGEGKLVDVCLLVTTTLPEKQITISIAENGTGSCYILPEDAVVSVCEDVEYMVCQWDNGKNNILAAEAMINNYFYTFSLTSSPQDIDQAKEDFIRVLECFAYYAEGKPELSKITAESIPEWFDKKLTYKEALEEPDYGAYMLPSIPEGFTTESIRRYKDQDLDYLSGLWTKGYDELSWKVQRISESDKARITGVNDTENYDLTLYPIPRASSVPEELRDIVDNPIFRVEELTQETVWARSYQVEDVGDSDGWRMKFSVKYGELLVEICAKGIDPEWIYQQLEALNKE